MKYSKRLHTAFASAKVPALVLNHFDGVAPLSTVAKHTCASCKASVIVNTMAEPVCPVCSGALVVSKNKSEKTTMTAKEVKELPIICTCAGCDGVIRAPYELRAELTGQKIRCPICAAENEVPEPEDDDENDTGDESTMLDNADEDDDSGSLTDETNEGDVDDDDDTSDDDMPSDDDMSSDDDMTSDDDDTSDDTSDDDMSSDDDDASATTAGDDDSEDISGDPDSATDTSDADEGTEDDSEDERPEEQMTPDEETPVPDSMGDESIDVKSAVETTKSGGAKVTFILPKTLASTPIVVSVKAGKASFRKAPAKAKTIKASVLASILATPKEDDRHEVVQCNTGENSIWYWFVNSQPVAVATYKDASDSVKKIFASRSFATAFTTAASDGLTDERLKDFGFKAIVSEVPLTLATSQEIERRVAEKTVAHTGRTKELRAAFEQALGIAAEGFNKGVFREKNKLRANLIAKLKSLNVKSAEAVVDTVMAENAKPFMAEIVAKAIELVNKPEISRNEIAAMVAEAEYRHSTTATTTKQEPTETPFPLSLGTDGATSLEVTTAGSPSSENADIFNLMRGIRRGE